MGKNLCLANIIEQKYVAWRWQEGALPSDFAGEMETSIIIEDCHVVVTLNSLDLNEIRFKVTRAFEASINIKKGN